MTHAAIRGISQHRESAGAIRPSSTVEIDDAIAVLAAKKDDWAKLPIPDRRAILRELIRDFSGVAEVWADACREAEGLAAGTATAGEEWITGPYLILRNLRLLEAALADVAARGEPRIPGPIRSRPDGRLTVQVFPHSAYDRIFYSGVSAEVWMEPGLTREQLPATQAVAYKSADPPSGVALVLGAGNVSSIGPMDALYKLFVENRVVIYKTHPLNAYLGPILADGFRALVDWGVLRIVYGGAAEGESLCNHPDVDEIHITGSDKTVEAIVFGTGDEGRKRKAERRPKLEKAISSELGNVSPVIIVPGPWSAGDVAYHAESLAAMLTNNAGFNCNAARVIIQHDAWSERPAVLEALRRRFAQIPPRKAFYPGAAQRHADFVKAHPEAEHYGRGGEGTLPWTLIPGVDSTGDDDVCFRTEAFCSVVAETALGGATVPEYLDRAVEFANQRLWGTLNATVVVHPASLRDPETAAAFDRALAELRYGTVAVNSWAAIGFALVTTSWGAYPGHDLYDIQSGSGVVHNTLMFSRIEKTVVRSPFRMRPKPPWFPTHKTTLALAGKLTRFEARPSPWKLPGIFWEALRG
ncbi:MAG: aldehyde dehydrogenase family protein [bacterium]|nr:aldehyde dehydrogenase family protein [bacterium]